MITRHFRRNRQSVFSAQRLAFYSLATFLMALNANLKLAASAADNTTNRASTEVWDTTIRATVGGGYRDNVLGSSVAPESSSFFISSADASFIRFSESGATFSLLLLSEDVRFFDSPSVDKEQYFSSSAQFSLPAGERDEVGGYLLYLYQNQVFDVSDSEANLRRLLVEGHSVSVRPHWEHTFTRGWSVRLEGIMLRQLYVSELDNFWEGGGKLSLIHSYGRRSEWSVNYQSRHRYYDTRLQADSNGNLLNNTSLVYWQQEIGGEWRHYWDAGHHWRTRTRTGVLLSRDNGSGYFDYDRVQFAQQLRWNNYGWEISANVRFAWHFHRIQKVAREQRERSAYALDFRAEKRLGKYWLLYAAAERAWNFSNDPLDEYTDWMGSGGIGVEF